MMVVGLTILFFSESKATTSSSSTGKKRGLDLPEALDKAKNAKVAKSTKKLNDFSSW
jgi:hypothetical protein